MRSLLFILMFGLVVLFVSGCGDSNSPKEVVKSFCSSDFAQSKQYIVPGKADAYEEKCREFHQTFKQELNSKFPKTFFKGRRISKVQVNGTVAEVELDASEDGSVTIVFDLKQIDGKWYISRVPIVPAFM